jgi:hypothetical protein
MNSQLAYKILELESGAEYDKIRRQYKMLALKYHPDKNIGNPESASKKYQEIKEAHDFLCGMGEASFTAKKGNTYIRTASDFFEMIYNDEQFQRRIFHPLLMRVVSSCEEKAVSMFRKMDKSKAKKLYNVLLIYRDTLHLSDDILGKIEGVIDNVDTDAANTDGLDTDNGAGGAEGADTDGLDTDAANTDGLDTDNGLDINGLDTDNIYVNNCTYTNEDVNDNAEILGVDIDKDINHEGVDTDIIILNPDLDDLLNQSVYKLKQKDGSILIVPLWHRELEYYGGILNCSPLLPSNIWLDDFNNIHCMLRFRPCDLLNQDHKEICVGSKTVFLSVNKLKWVSRQILQLDGLGIPVPNEADIFNVSQLSHIYAHVEII